MEKYIYKIENKINGKVYIGQTNNLKRRLQEHRHDKRKHHPVHEAIKKYGFENFIVTVLYHGENYNEEEKKYIKLYKSNNKKYGYNIVDGGQDSSGENNPQSKLLQSEVNDIIDDLEKEILSIKDIAKKYNTTVKTVRNINAGIAWRVYEKQYPIRKPKNSVLQEQDVEKIIELLKDDKCSIKDIAQKFNVKEYIILNINRGKTYKRDEVYPIRELALKEKDYDEIIKLLRNEKIPIKEIALRFNKSLSEI